jgi:hypothetical protein
VCSILPLVQSGNQARLAAPKRRQTLLSGASAPAAKECALLPSSAVVVNKDVASLQAACLIISGSIRSVLPEIGHDKPEWQVTFNRNDRSRYRNGRSQWTGIPNRMVTSRDANNRRLFSPLIYEVVRAD